MSFRLIGLALLALAVTASAQEPAPSGPPLPPEAQEPVPPEGAPLPQPTPEPAAAPRPPGSIRIGRLFVTPRLRLDTVGVDTNVTDTTGEDPKTDFIAIGGPSLELLFPIRRSTQLSAEGHVSYVYYADTPSQRRYLGGGSAGFAWNTGRTSFALSAKDNREYRRLDEELERRVEQRERSGTVELHRRILGRLGVRGLATLAERSLPDERGVEGGLAAVYDRQELQTFAGLEYSLTYKTSLLVEVERSESVFDTAEDRDGRFEGIRGGIQTDTTALISGRIIVGRRRLVLDVADGTPPPRFTSVEVEPTWNVSTRTRLGVFYRQAQTYSVLASSEAPIVESRRWGAHVFKELLTRLEVGGRAERSEYGRERGKDYRDEAFGEVVYRWRRFGIGFRVGKVRSPASAFVRQRAFEGTVGGLVVRYR